MATGTADVHAALIAARHHLPVRVLSTTRYSPPTDRPGSRQSAPPRGVWCRWTVTRSDAGACRRGGCGRGWVHGRPADHLSA
ncbi:hypothetical protein [Streptomyces sp. NPDC058304]|uniref:hypothetical protein n=1 Tax=Streptomyces sp. NPDC058304 TaxID=3346437 RepID=UPI0036EAF7F0